MAASSHWQLVSALTVYQAALLMVGQDPVNFQDTDFENWPEVVRKDAVPLVYAIQGKVRSEIIDFVDRVRISYDTNEEYHSDKNIDWKSSKLSTVDIRNWVEFNGIREVFFTRPAQKHADALEPSHPCFPLKLFAANAVWKALVENPRLIHKISVKKAAERWLERNAKEYGLLKADGTLNRTAITEIATVVNWNPKGGAPSSQEAKSKPQESFGGKVGEVEGNSQVGYPDYDELDDEIPF